VPIALLDVAGLVPGAHAGRGLGNRFLDDLRHADALVHIVDASGTTDAEGKATRGYDPAADVRWLRAEIVAWVLGNLREKWAGVRRRHVAVSESLLLLRGRGPWLRAWADVCVIRRGVGGGDAAEPVLRVRVDGRGGGEGAGRLGAQGAAGAVERRDG